MHRSSKVRAAFGGGLAFGLGALMMACGSPVAFASSTSSLPTLIPSQALYDVGIKHGVSADAAAAPAAGSLATFTSTVTDSGKKYKYTIVGKNPAKAGAASTTVTTQLIPLIIKLPNGDTFDPTVADSCDSSTSNVARAQQSPIFVSQAWTWGGNSIGTSQYAGAFNRAEFWKYAQPGGISPNYNVNLGLTTLPAITITVPSAYAAEGTGVPCGNGKYGGMEINWFDHYIQTTILPSLASKGAGPSTFPLFLLGNVVEYITTVGNCCVLGFHNAIQASPSSPIQTYSVSMWDNTHLFTGSSDMSVLTHEVGEWVNDPFVVTTGNATRPWGHTGQVSGCQANFEVGDPLSGNIFAVQSGTFTYHAQELAFFSWFYRQSPSLGINGWYSNQGKFTTTQGTCH